MILIYTNSFIRSQEIADGLGLLLWRHVDGPGSLTGAGMGDRLLRDDSASCRHDCQAVESECRTRGVAIDDEWGDA